MTMPIQTLALQLSCGHVQDRDSDSAYADEHERVGKPVRCGICCQIVTITKVVFQSQRPGLRVLPKGA